MPNNGWASLGESLAGVSPANRAEIEAKTMNMLASRDRNVAAARMALDKVRYQQSLGENLAAQGIENPDAVAGTVLAGVNYNQLQSGLNRQQERGFRQAAVDAPDWNTANRQMLGVANGPQALAAVQGGTVIGNRFVEGGDIRGPTAVGQAQIGNYMASADQRYAGASLSRAREAWGPSAGRKVAAGLKDPKLGQIDQQRMTAELKALDMQRDALQSTMQDMDPQAQAHVQGRLKAIEVQRKGVFDRYDQRLKAKGDEGKSLNGQPVPEGWTSGQFGNLIAINQDRHKEGLPSLTGQEAAQFQSTGEFHPKKVTAKRPGTGMVVKAAPPKVPKVGMVQAGYRFMGGDPGQKASWRKL